MKLLGASLLLCVLLPVGRALPLNTTTPKFPGLCEYVVQQSTAIVGAFIPACDANGNFLPQQCSGSTGFCWCVQPLSGEEIPNTRTPPGTSPVNCDSEFYCPYGWSRFASRCYIFIHSEKPWPEAESYCRFEAANLASVHSYEEDHFIQGLSRGSGYDFPESWIGGHDAIHHGFWMWSDGSRFNYENWHKNHDNMGTDHCVKINYGYDRRWDFGPCEDRLPFVCSKRV